MSFDLVGGQSGGKQTVDLGEVDAGGLRRGEGTNVGRLEWLGGRGVRCGVGFKRGRRRGRLDDDSSR